MLGRRESKEGRWVDCMSKAWRSGGAGDAGGDRVCGVQRTARKGDQEPATWGCGARTELGRRGRGSK